MTVFVSDELEKEVILEELTEEWERLERNTTEVLKKMLERLTVTVIAPVDCELSSSSNSLSTATNEAEADYILSFVDRTQSWNVRRYFGILRYLRILVSAAIWN